MNQRIIESANSDKRYAISDTSHSSLFTHHASRLTHYSLLVIVLLLAAYLRLNHLEWTEFKQDEAHLSQIAYDMAWHGQIPLTGIGSSVGIVNPPMAAWLLSIPYSLSADPIIATAFVAALNVLAVAMSYRLAKKMFSPFSRSDFIPILVAFLFAVSPWSIIYSRKIWAQDLLPPLIVAYIALGYRAFVEHKQRSLIGHALVLAVLIQIHYSALWLIPVSALWSIVFVRRVRFKTLLISGVLFAIMFMPFLIADGLQNWTNVKRLAEVASQPAIVDTAAVQNVWWITVGQNIHSLAGPQEFQNFLAAVPSVDGLLALEGVMMLLGVVFGCAEIFRAVRQRSWSQRSMTSLMLVAWLILPVVLQISHRTPVFLHYFIILLPVQFLLIGLLMTHLSRRFKWLYRLGLGFLLLIGLLQAYQIIVLQQFVATRPTPGGASIPIGYYESIVNVAKSTLTDNHATEIVVNTIGSDVQIDEYPAIFNFLLNGVPHRFVDASQSIQVIPQQPNIQIDYSPAAPLLSSVGRNQIAQIALRVGEQPSQIYKADGYSSLPCNSSLSARWANNTTLLSANLDQFKAGQTGLIHLCVQLNQNSPNTDYHWTNQLFDRSGKRWAQVDSAGFPSHSWRSGDVVLLTFQISLPNDLPAGDYKLRIGQYTYPEISSVPVIDVMNNPQSDAVEIPMTVR